MKRILALILAVFMIFAIASCDKNKDDQIPDMPTDSTPAKPTDPDPDEEGVDRDGIYNDNIFDDGWTKW